MKLEIALAYSNHLRDGTIDAAFSAFGNKIGSHEGKNFDLSHFA